MKVQEGKLPKMFKRKWVKALRSKKYKQGSSSLYSEMGGESEYCCLGVACIVAGATIDQIKWSGTISEGIEAEIKVPELLVGDTTENDLVAKLVQMNDGSDGHVKRSFTYIASYIERYL